jgi:DnaJ family protein C protein 7
MKQSSRDSTSADVSRAQTVKSRIAKCNDARKLKDWITVLRESQTAFADGADSAPQVSATNTRRGGRQLCTTGNEKIILHERV